MEFDPHSALRILAWLLAAWAAISVAAAVVVTRLFRARARLNDQLAADGRREDWAAEAGAPGEAQGAARAAR